MASPKNREAAGKAGAGRRGPEEGELPLAGTKAAPPSYREASSLEGATCQAPAKEEILHSCPVRLVTPGLVLFGDLVPFPASLLSLSETRVESQRRFFFILLVTWTVPQSWALMKGNVGGIC